MRNADQDKAGILLAKIGKRLSASRRSRILCSTWPCGNTEAPPHPYKLRTALSLSYYLLRRLVSAYMRTGLVKLPLLLLIDRGEYLCQGRKPLFVEVAGFTPYHDFHHVSNQFRHI
jgi:hypothetical protein